MSQIMVFLALENTYETKVLRHETELDLKRNLISKSTSS